AVCVLTTLNVMGVKKGSRRQNLLVSIKILGLTVMFIVGVVFGAPPPQPSAAASSPPAFGLAMILVLLTYGGWNEAAYISSEVREGRRNMARALLWSIGAITTIYVLINFTYLRGLVLEPDRSALRHSTLLVRRTSEGRISFFAMNVLMKMIARMTRISEKPMPPVRPGGRSLRKGRRIGSVVR